MSERQGADARQEIYHTNKQFPIFKELQSICVKSQRLNQRDKAPLRRKEAYCKLTPDGIY